MSTSPCALLSFSNLARFSLPPLHPTPEKEKAKMLFKAWAHKTQKITSAVFQARQDTEQTQIQRKGEINLSLTEGSRKEFVVMFNPPYIF